MINLFEAIINLYPQVTHSVGDTAFDKDNNEVQYDLAAVQAKALELQEEAQAAIQAQTDARQSAINKLMALGLTEEEALALGVK